LFAIKSFFGDKESNVNPQFSRHFVRLDKLLLDLQASGEHRESECVAGLRERMNRQGVPLTQREGQALQRGMIRVRQERER
jgi:hypothetical protein